MFKNRIYIYLIRAGYTTLDKPMASVATCHLKIVVWDGSLVKFVLSC